MLLSKIQNSQKLALPYLTKRCLKRCLGREQSFGKGFRVQFLIFSDIGFENWQNFSLVLLIKACIMSDSHVENLFRSRNYFNKFAYKILCGIQIKCPNKDCNEKLLAGNLKDHLKKCEYQTTHCKYCDAKNIFRKDLKKHMVENMDVHFLKVVEELEDLKMKVSKKD